MSQSKLSPLIQEQTNLLIRCKPKNLLFQYLRDKHRQRVGIVLARVIPNDVENFPETVEVQFSKCHSSLDRFNRLTGLHIAWSRCDYGSIHPNQLSKLSPTYQSQIKSFIRRTLNYFNKANLNGGNFDVKRLESLLDKDEQTKITRI